MLKVTIYIEKDEFDLFFIWINRLNNGLITSKPVAYSTAPEGFRKPLQLSLDPNMYYLIQDAESDLKTLEDTFGEINIEFEPMSRSWELRTINDILRNSRRYDLEAHLVYTALYTLSDVPDLSPAEAMIIAEREWITRRKNADA
jgi:hypothetical protein